SVSESGQKRTSRPRNATSVLPRPADIIRPASVDPVGAKSRLVSPLCLRLKYRSRFPRNLHNTGEASVINKTLAAFLACMACLISNVADAAEIKILCASGMREVVSELQPRLARLVGQEVSIS